MGECYKKEIFILYKEEISSIPLLTIKSWNETLYHWAPPKLEMLKWILGKDFCIDYEAEPIDANSFF